MSDNKFYFFSALCALAWIVIVIVCFQIDEFFGLPVVFTSATLQKCVKVTTYEGDIIDKGCDNLPEKYLNISVR